MSRELTLNLRAFRLPYMFAAHCTGSLSIHVSLKRDGADTQIYSEKEIDITHFPGSVSVTLKDVLETDLIICHVYFCKHGQHLPNPWKYTFETIGLMTGEPQINVHKYTYNAPEVNLRMSKAWN